MMQSALVGSWYNSGFYGHYRGQFKCELAQEYRLAAKPQPPAVFLQRIKQINSGTPQQQAFFDDLNDAVARGSSLMAYNPVIVNEETHGHCDDSTFNISHCLFFFEEPPRKHLFSKHDNRGVFDPGIGKRKAWEKLKKKCNVFNWPSDDEAQGPLVSSYQKDYYQKQSGGGMHGPIFQPLVHYIQSGAPQSLQLNRIPSTTYQHTFCHQLVSQMPDEKFKKEVSETREKLGISQLSESKEKLGISQLSESKEKLWISPCPAPSAFSETLPELPVTVNRKKVEPFLHFTVSDSLRWLDPLKKLG